MFRDVLGGFTRGRVQREMYGPMATGTLYSKAQAGVEDVGETRDII